MEKKIVGISALCFGLVAVIALLGVLIQDIAIRRIVIIAGCIFVVLLTFLNFKLLKQMKDAVGQVPLEKPEKLLSMDELARWLQSKTWAEILSESRLGQQYPAEFADFRNRMSDEPVIKGFRIWRSEENEKYFDETSGNAESILVLMEMTTGQIDVYHSNILYQQLMLKQK